MTRRTRMLHPLLLILVLMAAAGAPRPIQAASVAGAVPDAAAMRAVARDSLGLLWLGTAEGLLSWDGRHLQRLDARDGWEGGGVAALDVDEAGRLWAAADSGLFRRDESFRQVETNSPVGLGRPRALLARGEAAWLATERGLLLIHERLGERVLLSGMAVTCLARLPGGDLVCGTADRGLYRFDAEGNPAAMPESYRNLLPEVAALAALSPGDRPEGGLLVLGRSGAEWRLGRLASQGSLSLLPARLPSAWKRGPRLAPSPLGPLLTGNDPPLRWDGRALVPAPLPAPALPLPAAHVAERLPVLAWLQPEGRLAIQSQARGVLALQGDGMVLAWESPTAPGGWRPLQACRARGSQWMLLASGEERRLLEVTARGTRNPALDWFSPDAAGAFTPATICPEPGGAALLIGTDRRILRAGPARPGGRGGLDTLSSELGAHWMSPFTPGSVLVGGPAGLAILEDGELRRLRVSESVHRAVPDGFRGVLAACDSHLLRLNELDELDTLAYPDSLSPGRPDPGRALRQVLADASGRVWLLAERGLFLKAREDAPWTRPLAGLLGAGKGESGVILSMAADSSGRLWLSTEAGTGWLVPDRLPPVVALLQDLRELEQADRRLVLQLGAADPLGLLAPLVRVRLDDQPWSAWRAPGPMPLGELLPPDVKGGTYRLQLQAMDAWGNLSRSTLVLPLVLPEGLGRLPFAKRLFLLLSMVGISVLATVFYPGRHGMLVAAGLGVAVGAWVRAATTEPHLWWMLPIILALASKSTSDQIRARRERRAARETEPGILEVVDLLRDFGHSGSATRNLDRLLRSARNLYLEGRPDPEVLGRFLTARGVFLDLTAPSLELLFAALRRLGAGERPLAEGELERLEALVRGVVRLLESCGDPPAAASLEELAFQLDRMEQALGETQHRVDLKISSAPLKVLDRVLEDRAAELAGVELELRCEREIRQVLVRLPVDKLQFILDNLVDNALHWMRDQPLRRLGIDVRERPATLQLRVTDTGPGVPATQRERIFEAGVSGRPGGAEGGRGYGLYRSREILARFGGRLVVEDGPEAGGATFLLEIKKVEPEARPGGWNAS